MREARELKPGNRLARCRFPVIKGAHLDSVLNWLSSLCDSCKHTRIEKGYFIIEDGDPDKQDQFMDAKMLFQTCGVNPKLETVGDGTKRLVITNDGLNKLKFYGFRRKNVDVGAYEPNDEALKEWDVIVTEIIHNGRRDDTYCFNEPMRHRGIFNGLLTGQCTEIVEYSASDETAVCNLGSIGLPMFVHPPTKLPLVVSTPLRLENHPIPTLILRSGIVQTAVKYTTNKTNKPHKKYSNELFHSNIFALIKLLQVTEHIV
jgi:hypothetical protein